MTTPTVLISGGGIAGATLAYWLARHGFRPTVVENAHGLRSSGNPIDVKGPAVTVAEQMGVMAAIRAARTPTRGLTFVDARGRRVGRVSMRVGRGSAGDREVELPRGDLARILYEASRDHAEFLWDDTVTDLRQDPGGVEVTFARADPRRFDLVVGADGLHSTVRRIAFAPEPAVVTHMGLYVATTRLDRPADDPHDIVMYNTPGKTVAVHPSTGEGLAFFCFRSPALPDFDPRDTAQHKRLLTEVYADSGWVVPDLLRYVATAADLYCDAVSRVELPDWSSGRVALVGDAASCVSLLGDGSTLAMAGAYTLARELATGADHQAAFARYEAAHRRLVAPKVRQAPQAAALIVPATRAGIVARNLLSHLTPLAAAAGALRRRVHPRRTPVA